MTAILPVSTDSVPYRNHRYAISLAVREFFPRVLG
jgi:hypothetical protein